ncbi:G_PROTEIN_RECEP_F1_2 domain-containing protein [Meloidogyne graminicola]|uniref:G_PROTEIN_RECEP_F1_2 domain-containing protein n=1 Tax=Meloidogyne graminicola TaxID=189291 RepID=A0A8S9ZU96_9BILA|nr:G_PROTEIN_RECEP_F1_2 domain-containing protein [Meloidogyne graminicola]
MENNNIRSGINVLFNLNRTNDTETTETFEPTKTLLQPYTEIDNETMFFLKFYEETRSFERLVGIIIPSIFALFALFGLVGNLLVVIVALNRQMRNSTNTLIIGLTCSDLMFLTLCIPFTAIDYAFPIWVLPTWMCPLINYLQHSSAYFSVWTLTLMAADRFLAVVFPVESMTLRTPKNTFFVLLIVYTVILFSQIQVGRIHGVYTYTFIMEQRSTCAIVSIAQGLATVSEARLYFFSFNIFGYCLPLGITCVLYYLMLKRLWYAPFRPINNDNNTKASIPNTKISSLFTNNSERAKISLRSRPETIKAKRKVTRLVLCVVIIWAVCWFPLNLCFFASGIIYPDTLVLRGGKPIVVIQIFSQVLAYCNSTLNPILYPLVSENFRKGFLRVLSTLANWLSCGRCCKQFHLYNTRMELTMLNRSTSNKSKNAISHSNSKNTTGSTKTTTNQVQSAYEPSMFSLLHRASLAKRCSAVSIAERVTLSGCSTARIRILSRGESASFLSVEPNNFLHNFPLQQKTIINRRQSKIILNPPTDIHRPSRHSLLEAKRSGEENNEKLNKNAEQQRRHSNEEKILSSNKNEDKKKILIFKEEEHCEYKFEDGGFGNLI